MPYMFLALLYFIWATARTAFVAQLMRAGIACGWHIAEVIFHLAVAIAYLIQHTYH